MTSNPKFTDKVDQSLWCKQSCIDRECFVPGRFPTLRDRARRKHGNLAHDSGKYETICTPCSAHALFRRNWRRDIGGILTGFEGRQQDRGRLATSYLTTRARPRTPGDCRHLAYRTLCTPLRHCSAGVANLGAGRLDCTDLQSHGPNLTAPRDCRRRRPPITRTWLRTTTCPPEESEMT